MDGGVLAGRILTGSDSQKGAVMEETSAVLRFKVHRTERLRFGRKLKACRSEWMDLVKRCDQPRSVLIQLESLILAQSERWRQA